MPRWTCSTAPSGGRTICPRPRWTAEVTAPVMRWLQTAPAKDVARLKKHLKSGRFGISGFEYNTTPLCSAEGLARQLYPVRTLREQLGADIRTVHQHDVTGLPWSAVDLLLDSRIELLIMGINLHLSGTPMPRPAVYRWRGPSGRELLVMNGEHYSMFDQWCDPSSRNLETIQAGLYKYLRHVKGLKYPYDFVYLSATYAPFMYDNSPPNQDLPDLVRQWNEEGRQPRLRLVTPNELLARIKQIPREQIPVVTGDWTDYWNFGSASSAAETALSREADGQRRRHRSAAHLEQARLAHGRGHRAPLGRHQPLQRAHLGRPQHAGCRQSVRRHAMASQGRARPTTASRSRIFTCAANCTAWPAIRGNPGTPTACWSSTRPALRQNYFVPENWKSGGKQIESHFMGVEREATARPLDKLYGPVQLEPFSWQVIPWRS